VPGLRLSALAQLFILALLAARTIWALRGLLRLYPR
jgi:hypothetical protein